MSKELNAPMIKDAIKYIADFGGYAKACQAESSACFLTHEEYLYHKMCLDIFIDYHNINNQ